MQTVPLMIDDDARDLPGDRLICGFIGHAVAAAYPGWEWRIEIAPPHNNRLIIVRCLTVDFRGKWGFAVHRDKVADVKLACVKGAGAFLERYEHQKGHAGRFRPVDVDPVAGIFVKPQT